MLTIKLPPDIEGPLLEEARRRGTTPEQLALDTLRHALAPDEATGEAGDGETLFDFLAGYAGTVSGSPEAWSENSGVQFADGLVEKQQQGRL